MWQMWSFDALRLVTFCLIFSSSRCDPASLSSSSSVSTATTAAKPGLQARLRSVEPDYGPIAGGTEITILGEDLLCGGGKIKVLLDEFPGLNCTISEQTSLKCLTPAIDSPRNTSLYVSCAVNDSSITWNISDALKFSYRPNPVLESIYPKASIISGGIVQTVTGQNLDSVAYPKMVTHYLQQNKPVDLTQSCSRHQGLDNRVYLKCETVAVSLDGVTINDSARTQPGEIVSSNVSIGFIFDGLQLDWKYRLSMFFDPVIDPFLPETMDFLTSEANLFSYHGSFPRLNFSVDDIKVRMGGMSCDNALIRDNTVTCRAPMLSKSVIRYGPSELNTLDVKVLVGKYSAQLGHLHYTSVEDFNIIMIVMIVVLAFIFVVSCLCGCLTLCGCRRRTKGPGFKAMPDSDFESPFDQTGNDENGDSTKLGFGKKRPKRGGGGKSDDDRDQAIECVAMQYRTDKEGERL